MDEALALTEAMAISALGIGPPEFVMVGAASQANVLGSDTDDNTYMFALSAVQEIINRLAQDLADDGKLSSGLVEQLARP